MPRPAANPYLFGSREPRPSVSSHAAWPALGPARRTPAVRRESLIDGVPDAGCADLAVMRECAEPR